MSKFGSPELGVHAAVRDSAGINTGGRCGQREMLSDCSGLRGCWSWSSAGLGRLSLHTPHQPVTARGPLWEGRPGPGVLHRCGMPVGAPPSAPTKRRALSLVAPASPDTEDSDIIKSLLIRLEAVPRQ